jgi:hypothetical protein
MAAEAGRLPILCQSGGLFVRPGAGCGMRGGGQAAPCLEGSHGHRRRRTVARKASGPENLGLEPVSRRADRSPQPLGSGEPEKGVLARGDKASSGGSKRAKFRFLRAGIFAAGLQPTEMTGSFRRSGRAGNCGRIVGGEVPLTCWTDLPNDTKDYLVWRCIACPTCGPASRPLP